MRQREENGPGQPRKNVKNVGQIRPTPNVSEGSVSWHQSTGGIKGSLAGSPNKAWQSQTAFLKGKHLLHLFGGQTSNVPPAGKHGTHHWVDLMGELTALPRFPRTTCKLMNK